MADVVLNLNGLRKLERSADRYLEDSLVPQIIRSMDRRLRKAGEPSRVRFLGHTRYDRRRKQLVVRDRKAAYTELGTGLFAENVQGMNISRGPIRPRRAKLLVWKDRNGVIHRARSVRGIRARHFLGASAKERRFR